MDGFWDLFCATGDPVFYLLHRQPPGGGKENEAKTG